MSKEIAKNSRATSQILQASVRMLNVKVHDCTIRRRLNKHGLFGRVAGESLFSLKRTCQHSLGLQSYICTNHKTSGTMSFEQTRPKWRCLVKMHGSMFGENQIQHISTNISYQMSSTVVEGWWFWLVLQPQNAATGQLAVIESNMKSSVYQSNLQSNVRPFVWQLKFGLCNGTIIPRRPANQQQNGWKRKESRCCRGPVKLHTSAWLEC